MMKKNDKGVTRICTRRENVCFELKVIYENSFLWIMIVCWKFQETTFVAIIDFSSVMLHNCNMCVLSPYEDLGCHLEKFYVTNMSFLSNENFISTYLNKSYQKLKIQRVLTNKRDNVNQIRIKKIGLGRTCC